MEVSDQPYNPDALPSAKETLVFIG